MTQSVAEQTRIQVRTSKALKEEANEVFAGMGIDMTSAINMFLSQTVKEGGLPFQPTSRTPLESAVRKAEASGFVRAVTADEARKMLEHV